MGHIRKSQGTPDTTLEQTDIQAIVLAGHGKLPASCAILLAISDPARFRVALAGVLPHITTADQTRRADKPVRAAQLAFTFSGLSTLGLSRASLATFSAEFQSGMSDPARTRVLGDTGASDPSSWDWGGWKAPSPDVLVLLYAPSVPDLDRWQAEFLGVVAQDGAAEVLAIEPTHLRADQTEPFGFRDGIAQPKLSINPSKEERRAGFVQAGEFLFGYPNSYGVTAVGPTVLPSYDDTGLLAVANTASATHDLGRNGSYLVLRKLRQDIDGFKKFLEDNSRRPDGTVDGAAKDLLAAKLVGRHKGGAPLVLSPLTDDTALGADSKRNDRFGYAREDPNGLLCPHAAHIRRCNPRDSMDPNPDRALEEANRHRLLRRGRAYLRPPGPGGPKEEGILFIALNTDLRRQFEFVQQTWVNNPKFAGLFDTKDPLAGDNDGTGTMIIPQAPFRRRICGIPRFVITRGGGFFFLPGMRALRYLAIADFSTAVPAVPAIPPAAGA